MPAAVAAEVSAPAADMVAEPVVAAGTAAVWEIAVVDYKLVVD